MNNVTSNKMGVVKKCPNCGATVEMSMVRCPECGYHFGGVEANSSARELAAMLNRATGKNEYKRSNIVVNFPVPTTKADLLEFMADLLYRAKHYEESGEYKMASAFKAKFKECAMKARIFFRKDPDFQHLFEIESKIKIKTKKIINVSGSTKSYLQYFGCLFILLLFCVLLIVGAEYFSDTNVEKRKAEKMLTEFKEEYKALSQQVKEQVDKGDLKQAEFLLTQVNAPSNFSFLDDEAKEITSFLDNAFIIVVQYYIDNGDIKNAERIGALLKGKIDSYLYTKTMTYQQLQRYEENDETSYNSRNSNSSEKNDVDGNNQVAKQTEEIANQIQSQVEDYTEEIRSQAED